MPGDLELAVRPESKSGECHLDTDAAIAETPTRVKGLYVDNEYRMIVSTEGSGVEADSEHAAWVNQWMRRGDRLSKTGLVLVLLGFALQIWAIICF